MIQTQALVDALKRLVRQRGLTYVDVARHLELSEASVKRLFSRYSFTLSRLEQVCDLVGVPIAELARQVEEQPEPLTMLTPEQEEELLADPKLLLAAYMALNDWQFAEITATFKITEPELIQRLARLDHLGMIELLPGNRVRKLTARNFTWRLNGPVQAYFEQGVKQHFLNSRFSRDADLMRFVGGRLSPDSLARMHQAIVRITREFDDLVKTDAKLPHESKLGVGAVFAIRPWELPAFSKLRRETDDDGG
ncbi:MAG: helix-turn-helix transcriptional regulator [Pseudomonadota bacterium]